MGFSAVKLRAHYPDWRDDVAVIERAREAVGPDLALMVDANQGFHFSLLPGAPPKWDVDIAAAFASAIEPCDMTWIEEPLDRNDYAALAELRQRTSIPLAGGELNWRLNEYGLLVEKHCLDVLQADAMFFGGISGCRKVAALAEENGLAFAAHTWNNGFALLANLHLMAACPNCEWCEFPYEPPGWTTEGRDALLAETTEIDSDGFVHRAAAPRPRHRDRRGQAGELRRALLRRPGVNPRAPQKTVTAGRSTSSVLQGASASGSERMYRL